MKYFFLSVIISLLSSINILSQQNYGILRGFISDSTNGEVLAYATVVIDGTKHGAASDTRGFYYIPSIPSGKHVAIYSYMGYLTKKVEINITTGQITDHNEQLNPVGLRLKEVVKYGKARRQNETDANLSIITGRELQIIPKGIEADLIRSLQVLPGVKTSNDISSRYYVRGGGSDQNLVLLDGVTIFNPFHALGIFSIVDPEIINNVQFYKGSFPVEFGGRLSSVMNIKTNDGNKNKMSASANASLLTGKVSLSGPIPDGSFLLDGRKSYFGKVMKNFLNNKDAPFDFYDLLAKVNYSNQTILKNSNFSGRVLLSNDKIEYGDPSLADYRFKNNLVSFDYFQVWEKPLWSNINFSVSNYNAEVVPNQSESKPRKNIVKEFSWKNDFTFLFDSRDELALGMQLRTFNTEFSFENRLGNMYSLNKFGANFDFYGKYRLLRFDQIGIDAGIRVSPVSLTAKNSQLILPSVSFTYRLIPEIAVKAAWGIYKQEIIAYSDDNDVVNIFEPYLIIPEYLSPSKAIHYMAGVDFNLSDFFSIQIESYYKKLLNIVDINRNKISSKDNDLISTNGESYGFEFQSKYSDETFYLSAGYTLSWAFKGIDQERYFPRYDSRHSVNLIAAVDIGAGFKASAVWTFNTGRPFTQSAGFFDKAYLQDYWNQLYIFDVIKPYALLGGRNAARLPVYHRLDLSLSKEFIVYFMKMSVEANLMNVYNRKNIFYFDRNTGERVNMLPFLPSLTLRVDL